MKKLLKKVSKKSILIASILIVLIGVPVLAYLFARDETEDTAAWYSSSWMYRRRIDLSCASCPQANAQYLVTLDTATLISQNKMRSDCGDLRFIDSNDSSTLSYWIEGGCNTATTQIWILIPSMNTNPYPVYTYYGNPSVTTTEQSWGGNFLTMNSNSTCPSGTTRNTNFDDRFVMGSSTFGSTGGSSASHTHNNMSVNFSGCTTVFLRTLESWFWPLVSHSHTATITIGNSTEVLPPFLSLPFCQGNKLNLTTSNIALYQTSVPSGWTRFTNLDNRFPLSSATYGTTGGATTHNHTSGSTTTSTASETAINNNPGSQDAVTQRTHSHSVPTHTSSNASNLPPFINVVYATPNVNGTAAPSGVINSVSSLPPLGWIRVTAFDNNFMQGSISYGGTGGQTSHTHTFTFTTETSTNSTTTHGTTSGSNQTCAPHTHTSSTQTTNSVSVTPPFYTLIFAQKRTSEGTSFENEEIFNTNPTAPTSLLTEGQTNPSRVTDLTPEFSAIFNDPDTGDTGIFYQIQVNTASNFGGTSMWDSGKTAISPIAIGARSPDISYNGSTLSLNGQTYYWRIKFWDQNGINDESPWSATAAFTMNRAPTEPTNLLTESSVNPIKVFDTTPEFSAVFNDPDTGDTGIHYQIQVSTVSNFTSTVWSSSQTSVSPITNGSRSPEISYAATPLALDGTLYYWRIKFWDNSGIESPWSTTATFRMSANPLVPIDLKVDGITNPTLIGSSRPTFYATHRDLNEDNAIFVEIHVNSNASFTGTIKWNTGKVSINPIAHNTEFTVTYGGTQLLGDNTTYYWRIRFWDVDDNISPWSTTASFVDLFKYTRMNGIGIDGLQIN